VEDEGTRGQGGNPVETWRKVRDMVPRGVWVGDAGSDLLRGRRPEREVQRKDAASSLLQARTKKARREESSPTTEGGEVRRKS